METYGYGEQDFIPCTYCKTERANDIHHLIPKGMGGSKTKDYIENLVALCRNCHNIAHSDREFNENLKILTKNMLQKLNK
jgi:5-methylcytosine-specific restriction endonuclease McrA